MSEAPEPRPCVRQAPAKLNLTLAITGKRADGFHSLHSVMVPLELADTVSVLPAPQDAVCDEMSVSGAVLECTPGNLVLRAVAAARGALRERNPATPDPPFVAAYLDKKIPIAAGLAGGSSDAAATLAATLETWGISLPDAQLSRVAASLGSDVPFFLAGCSAVVTGRGEHVEPLPPLRGVTPSVLVVTPGLPLSTAAVFAAYDAGARPAVGAASASERLAGSMRSGLDGGDLLSAASELAAANDLLPAALAVAPSLAAFRSALAELLGRPVGQSGSGPTAWILYPGAAEANAAAQLVRRAIADGRLPCPGEGTPFVAATAFAT